LMSPLARLNGATQEKEKNAAKRHVRHELEKARCGFMCRKATGGRGELKSSLKKATGADQKKSKK